MDTENVVVTKQDRKYKTLVTDIGKEKMTNAIPVSYTHLTLPTNREG